MVLADIILAQQVGGEANIYAVKVYADRQWHVRPRAEVGEGPFAWGPVRNQLGVSNHPLILFLRARERRIF